MADNTVYQLIHAHEKAVMPEKAAGVDAVIQYRLTGAEAGDYIITIKDAKCTVTDGIAPNPKMTLTADATDFMNIILGKMDPMMAFMQGKVKISGDMNLAMKVMSLFKMRS